MSDDLTFNSPRRSLFRHTPLRDLVRGRVTGRLDVRGRVAAAKLPAPVTQLVLRVIRQTRLWRLEKAAVADELIAHFTDGLASGATADELLRDFGDERTAARLIRRAKKRNRPLGWHLMKYAVRLLLVLIVLYGLLLIRFFTGRPSPSVDYLARLNAPIVSVSAPDRAWPHYRQAILALGLADSAHAAQQEAARKLQELLSSRPGDTNWPAAAAWIDAHEEAIETIHIGAQKPALGFVLGRGGSADDVALGTSYGASQQKRTLLDESLISILLPNLNYARSIANVLVADARLAAERGDGVRFVRDMESLRRFAAQHRGPILVAQLVSVGLDRLLLDELERVLRESPQLLDDAQLVRLAHLLAQIGGRTASTVLDLSGERIFFHDMVQRLYTDDGHGDGRLTREGAAALPLVSGVTGSRRFDLTLEQMLAQFGLLSLENGRRDVLAEYDRLLSHMEAQFARPMREVVASDDDLFVAERLAQIRASRIDSARLFPLLIFVPVFNAAQMSIEQVLGARDGVVVGIALELHRRQRGTYPATLEEMVPHLLPRVPEDRISGGPIRYRLVDGRPVLYSLGADRDDDGGHMPRDASGSPRLWDVAAWRPRPNQTGILDGDWVLFGDKP